MIINIKERELKMGKIEAIFLDLDGTTLTSEHTVSENLKKKLNELEKKGGFSPPFLKAKFITRFRPL